MDRKKLIIPIVGLALFTKNAGDLCAPNIETDYDIQITNPRTANILCQISSTNPEHPETHNPYHPVSLSSYSVSASGTSLSTVPSQTLFTLK